MARTNYGYNATDIYMKQNALVAEEVKKGGPDAYFYSLIRPYMKHKKRSCLRCGRVFKSESPSHRRCSVCEALVNPNVGAERHVW